MRARRRITITLGDLILVERAPWVPPEIVAVVMRALERDPKNRFQTAEEMHAALVALAPNGELRIVDRRHDGGEPAPKRPHWAIFAAPLVPVIGVLTVVGILRSQAQHKTLVAEPPHKIRLTHEAATHEADVTILENGTAIPSRVELSAKQAAIPVKANPNAGHAPVTPKPAASPL